MINSLSVPSSDCLHQSLRNLACTPADVRSCLMIAQLAFNRANKNAKLLPLYLTRSTSPSMLTFVSRSRRSPRTSGSPSSDPKMGSCPRTPCLCLRDADHEPTDRPFRSIRKSSPMEDPALSRQIGLILKPSLTNASCRHRQRFHDLFRAHRLGQHGVFASILDKIGICGKINDA